LIDPFLTAPLAVSEGQERFIKEIQLLVGKPLVDLTNRPARLSTRIPSQPDEIYWKMLWELLNRVCKGRRYLVRELFK